MEADSKAGQVVEPLSEMHVSAATSAGEAERRVKTAFFALNVVRFVDRDWSLADGRRLGALNWGVGNDMTMSRSADGSRTQWVLFTEESPHSLSSGEEDLWSGAFTIGCRRSGSRRCAGFEATDGERDAGR